MTLVEGTPHVPNEEALPLMQTLELDKQVQLHKHSLLERIQLQLKQVSPELIAITLVYFVQGILRLSSLAITFFEKDDLHMEPTQMAIVDTIAGLPWTIKPLYGIITDSFPIRGMRRRPYLILAGLVGATSWFCLAAFASTITTTVACITAAAAATAFSDVVADSIVVELARASPGSTEGALQSLCWGAHAFGRVITAYLSGWLVQVAGVRTVFLITATFPLVVSLSSCLISESKKLATAVQQREFHCKEHRGNTDTEQKSLLGINCISSSGAAATAAMKRGLQSAGVNDSTVDSIKHVEIMPASPLGVVQHTNEDNNLQISAFNLKQRQHCEQCIQTQAGDSTDHTVVSQIVQSSHSLAPDQQISCRASHQQFSRLHQHDSSHADISSTETSDKADSPGKIKAAGQHNAKDLWLTMWRGVRQSVGLFWDAVKQPHVLRPVLFLFLWQGMPNAGTAMFYFKTNQLHFDPEFFGRVKLVAALADLLGIVVYNSFLKQVKLRRLMLWGSLFGCALGLTPLMLVEGINRKLGISDKVFALVDSALLSSISQVLMMPTLVLSARLCPVGVEGTLYASLMSVNNFASGTSDMLGAVMMKVFDITSSNFMHLSALLLTCNLLSLLPLPLIGWVPNETAAGAAAAAQQRSDASTLGVAAAAAVGDIDGHVRVSFEDGQVMSGSTGQKANSLFVGLSLRGNEGAKYHKISDDDEAV